MQFIDYIYNISYQYIVIVLWHSIWSRGPRHPNWRYIFFRVSAKIFILINSFLIMYLFLNSEYRGILKKFFHRKGLEIENFISFCRILMCWAALFICKFYINYLWFKDQVISPITCSICIECVVDFLGDWLQTNLTMKIFW